MKDNTTRKFVKLGKAEEIPNPGTKSFTVQNLHILIACWQGNFYAIEDRCTHDNEPLREGTLDDEACIECPRHAARFDLRTGKALCLPATKNACVYSVVVREGDLYVGLPV